MFEGHQLDERPRRMAAWACLLLLLVVSSVQACHVCGLVEGSSQQPHSLNTQQAAASSSDICLICLSSQPATARIALATFAPNFLPSASTTLQQPLLLSAESLFALYIRPPPSH